MAFLLLCLCNKFLKVTFPRFSPDHDLLLFFNAWFSLIMKDRAL